MASNLSNIVSLQWLVWCSRTWTTLSWFGCTVMIVFFKPRVELRHQQRNETMSHFSAVYFVCISLNQSRPTIAVRHTISLHLSHKMATRHLGLFPQDSREKIYTKQNGGILPSFLHKQSDFFSGAFENLKSCDWLHTHRIGICYHYTKQLVCKLMQLNSGQIF